MECGIEFVVINKFLRMQMIRVQANRRPYPSYFSAFEAFLLVADCVPTVIIRLRQTALRRDLSPYALHVTVGVNEFRS